MNSTLAFFILLSFALLCSSSYIPDGLAWKSSPVFSNSHDQLASLTRSPSPIDSSDMLDVFTGSHISSITQAASRSIIGVDQASSSDKLGVYFFNSVHAPKLVYSGTTFATASSSCSDGTRYWAVVKNVGLITSRSPSVSSSWSVAYHHTEDISAASISTSCTGSSIIIDVGLSNGATVKAARSVVEISSSRSAIPKSTNATDS